MTKQKKNSRGSSHPAGAAKEPKSNFPTIPILVFVVGVGMLIWSIMGSFSSPKPADDTTVSTAAADQGGEEMMPSTNTPSAVVEEEPAAAEPLSDADRQTLLGKWERTDNPPYSIEVRLVKPDGVTDARYFNPRPINVAEAFTVGKGGQLALFMKMQDIGYEGSTYTLVYDKDQDLLVGEYFQATQRQTYDVAFQRKTE